MKKYLYIVGGCLIILVSWQLLCLTGLISSLLLPSPYKVFYSYIELSTKDYLLYNIFYSLKLNILGYIQAVAIAIPAGFIFGLIPPVRKLFSRYVDAIRYIPLTATIGLFIAWFGIEDTMKIQFLSFGIFVFLLPTVVQRIDEVETVYVDTVYTLGASKWQTICTVHFPSVISRVSDDIRVLVAISWTYLIVAELVNKTGGLGALVYTSARQSRVDKVFAILLLFIIIGIIQDRLFMLADKKMFKHKYI
ncbi:MAG TPA: ABC transporter permease subunit [Methanofastidiosum sp.]|nr:ABC transporter permease subunit [Methanofastidiosum sp.]